MTLIPALAEAARSGFSEYSAVFMPRLKEVLALQTDHSLLRVRFEHKTEADSDDRLRFAAVFNDVSFVQATSINKMSFVGMNQKGFEKYFGINSVQVSMPAPMAEKMGLDNKVETPIIPGFIFASGERSDEFLRSIEPLVLTGRVVVIPRRSLMMMSGENSEGQRSWTSHTVQSESPIGSWQILEETVSRGRPFEMVSRPHAQNPSDTVIFEMLVPYLRGIGFNDLAKILQDEGDLIAGLHSTIKDVTTKARPDQTSAELARDVIDPKLNLLTRKFRSLTETHALKIAGAALGSVTIAFTASATAGLSAAIATVAGAGGVGVLSKYYAEYREQRGRLTEDPFYFLWKCRERSQRR